MKKLTLIVLGSLFSLSAVAMSGNGCEGNPSSYCHSSAAPTPPAPAHAPGEQCYQGHCYIPHPVRVSIPGCLDNGPFRICQLVRSGKQALYAYYDGYLKDSSAEVHLQGQINGKTFDSVLNTYGRGQVMFQLISVPIGTERARLTVYAVDRDGRYDSNYGRNYDFDLEL